MTDMNQRDLAPDYTIRKSESRKHGIQNAIKRLQIDMAIAGNGYMRERLEKRMKALQEELRGCE